MSAANLNAPGQIVIAGAKQAVQAAITLAKEQGAKRAIELPVSVPSHCQLMQSAADKMADALKDVTFQTPNIPVIHNVDVKMHTDSEAIKTALIAQLSEPVRWIESVELLAEQGVAEVIECGPGKVLTGLLKRIDKSLVGLPIGEPDGFDQALTRAKAVTA